MGTIFIIFLAFLGCNNNDDLEEYVELMNNWKAFDAKIAKLNVSQRDLLLLRLAVRNPSQSSKLCKRVQSQNAIEKCKQVIGRPHLTTPQPQ